MDISEIFDSDEFHRRQVLEELAAARANIVGFQPDFEAAMRHIYLALEFSRLMVPEPIKRRHTQPTTPKGD